MVILKKRQSTQFRCGASASLLFLQLHAPTYLFSSYFFHYRETRTHKAQKAFPGWPHLGAPPPSGPDSFKWYGEMDI